MNKSKKKKGLVFLLAICLVALSVMSVSAAFGASYDQEGDVWDHETAEVDDNGWMTGTRTGAWGAGSKAYNGIDATSGRTKLTTMNESNLFNSTEIDLGEGALELTYKVDEGTTKIYMMLIPKYIYESNKRMQANTTPHPIRLALAGTSVETCNGFSSPSTTAWVGFDSSKAHTISFYVGTGGTDDKSFVLLKNKKIESTEKLSTFEVDTDGVKTYPAYICLFTKGPDREIELSMPQEVEKPTVPYSISFNINDARMSVGDTKQVASYQTSELLSAKVPNAEDYIWSSSNTSVATVDQDGIVTGVSEGTSTIQVSVEAEGDTYTASYIIKVYQYDANSGWMTTVSAGSWGVGVKADTYSYNETTKETTFTANNSCEVINNIPLDLTKGPIHFTYSINDTEGDWMIFNLLSESVFNDTKRVSNENPSPVGFYVRKDCIKPEIAKFEGATTTTIWPTPYRTKTDVIIYIGAGGTDRSFVSINNVVLYSKATLADYVDSEGGNTAYLHTFKAWELTISELKTGTAAVLSDNSVTMVTGQEKTITAEVVKAAGVADASVVWSSSDTAVATVSGGKITAVKAGSAVIKATVGDYVVTCAVEITDVEVTGVSMDKSTASVEVGKTVTLAAIHTPENVTVEIETEWASSNTAVATVDENGVVTALKEGTAVITVSCNGFEAECTVTVTAAAVVDPQEEDPDGGCKTASAGSYALLAGILLTLGGALIVLRKRSKKA